MKGISHLDSPHSAAELLVSHPRVVLDIAPHVGDNLGVDDPEDALPFVLPFDILGAVLLVLQDVEDEFP